MPHRRFIVEQPSSGLATLTIDRLERSNAFDLSMVTEMHSAWDEIEGDRGIRVVIIRSALPKVFVAGGDIEAMRNLNLEDGARTARAGGFGAASMGENERLRVFSQRPLDDG